MDQLNVLIVGSGGREHALAWAIEQSPRVRRVVVAPGNAGTAGSVSSEHSVSTRRQAVSKVSSVPIPAEDIAGLLAYAREAEIGLTVVGPEVPLADGIVDAFTAAGLRIFGPTRAAAQLEASKSFAKGFMQRHHIPTAEYGSFDDFEQASAWVHAFGRPVVVKADGLAAGKGVIMCETESDAIAALRRCMIDHEFGTASSTVVVEERLTGREVSILAFCDGQTVLTMPPARDHKRVFDNDEGPNTGGMGAYAPVPDVSPEFVDEIRRTVLQPVVDGMASIGTPYRGVLYAGIMLTPHGPRTLEFNCRFGDPETQVILPLLQSDLVDILLACTEGVLSEVARQVQWHEGACATIVAAAPGYPGAYKKGLPIAGLDILRAQSQGDPKGFPQQGMQEHKAIVFHAGTALSNNSVVTSGGRVLSVSARGDDLHSALDRAYDGLRHIHFEGMHYRKDIGTLR